LLPAVEDTLELGSLLEGDFEDRSGLGTSLDSDHLTVLVVDQSTHDVGQLESTSCAVAVQLQDLMQVVVEQALDESHVGAVRLPADRQDVGLVRLTVIGAVSTLRACSSRRVPSSFGFLLVLGGRLLSGSICSLRLLGGPSLSGSSNSLLLLLLVVVASRLGRRRRLLLDFSRRSRVSLRGFGVDGDLVNCGSSFDLRSLNFTHAQVKE